MSINVVYNKLTTGEPVKLSCSDNAYQTIRTGLIKKLKVTSDMLASIGDTSLAEQYVQAGYDRVTGVAVFKLANRVDMKRKTVSYTLL